MDRMYNQKKPDTTRVDRSKRRSTFSLTWLFYIVTVAAIWFALLYYSVGIGIAVGIVATLLVVRVKWHRNTAWKRGWRFGLIPILTTGILGFVSAWLVYGAVHMFLRAGILQLLEWPSFDIEALPAHWQTFSQIVASASALLLLESIVVFSLRHHDHEMTKATLPEQQSQVFAERSGDNAGS